VTHFGEKDVVRHALVTRIVSAYNKADAQKHGQ
jgi:phosphate starvation-inducible protein PhoH